MVIAILSILVLGQKSAKLNWNGPAAYTLSGRSGKHHWSVRLEQRNFEWRGRRPGVVAVHGKENYVPTLNGRRIYGFDGNFRKETLRLIDEMPTRGTSLVRVVMDLDGKRTVLSERWYEDLIDPNLGSDYVAAGFTKDGSKFVLSMLGSDGGGSYRVLWTLRKKGHGVSRKVYEGDEGLTIWPTPLH